jgi:hypothetical protein
VAATETVRDIMNSSGERLEMDERNFWSFDHRAGCTLSCITLHAEQAIFSTGRNRYEVWNAVSMTPGWTHLLYVELCHGVLTERREPNIKTEVVFVKSETEKRSPR